MSWFRDMLAELIRPPVEKGNPTMADVHVAAGGELAYGKRKKKKLPNTTQAAAVDRLKMLEKRTSMEAVEDEIVLRSVHTDRAHHAHYFQKAVHNWASGVARCLICGNPTPESTLICKGVPDDMSHLPDAFRHWVGAEKARFDAVSLAARSDSAFAAVRELAYKDGQGNVSVPHVMSALADLPVSNFPPDVRAAARRTLEKALVETLPAGAGEELEEGLQLLKANDEQKIWLVVSEPGEEDTQGDVINERDIARAAHDFLIRYRKGETRLRLQHAADLTDDQATLIEHFIAPTDFTMGTQPVKKGSWVQAWWIPNAEIWKAAKSGSFTGASLGGTGIRRPVNTEKDDAPSVVPIAPVPAPAPASGVTINMHMGGGSVRVERDAAGNPIRYVKEDTKEDAAVKAVLGRSS